MQNFDFTEERPDSEAELSEARRLARERLRLWGMRSLYAGVAFFLSCGAVSPFLYGQRLHIYWESAGRYLILLSMGLLVVLVYCVGLLWAAWSCLRDLEKDKI